MQEADCRSRGQYVQHSGVLSAQAYGLVHRLVLPKGYTEGSTYPLFKPALQCSRHSTSIDSSTARDVLRRDGDISDILPVDMLLPCSFLNAQAAMYPCAYFSNCQNV